MLRVILAFVMAAFALPAFAKPAVPTIEQLAAYPKMSSFSISPDGTHMAAIKAEGEEQVILVFRTDDLNAKPNILRATQMKIAAVTFIKNDVLAVTLWQPIDVRGEKITRTFINKLFFTDIEGKNWREPLPLPRATSRSEELEQALTNPQVLDILPNDPDNILVVNSVGTNAGDVYKVNVRANRAERIQRSDPGVGGYVVDLNGTLRARFKSDTDGKGAFVAAQFRNASGSWEEHFRSYVKDRDLTEVVGFTDDPNIALILSNAGEDKAAVYEYDIAAKKRREVLFRHPYFEATGVTTYRYKSSSAAKFGEIVGLDYDGPRGNDVIWTSPAFQQLDATLRQALKITATPVTFLDPATGKTANTKYDNELGYRLVNYTADLKTVVVAVDGPNTPASYYLLKDGQLTLLSKTYPDLDPAAFGTTKLVYYKARDGLDIPAFLTTPNTELCGPGPWKTVIHPHGGPWARDHMGFDYSMWVPLMSSRCMAVLRPQYRGSQGWSRKLWMAGDAEWGGKMQDDKDDGARWLIAQKIAQPGHIAIFGFSYGGYAALAASVRPNEGVYKCAISGAGVSDIRRIWAKFYTNPFFRDSQGPTVNGLSPVDKADHLQIPIMVYQGERDQTVPLEQAEWFVNKAKRANQPIVYHQFADYSHGQAWTRKIMGDQLQIIDDYLAKDCGGGGL